MEEYIKYCEEKHSIKLGCPTIHIGTLAYYRELDPAFAIADPTEQSEKTIIVSSDTTNADQEVQDRLLTVKVTNGGHIVMNNCMQEVFIPNCFVFCLSKITNVNYAENASRFKYTSYYKILDINAFAEEIAKLIIEDLRPDWFEDNVQELVASDLKSIQLCVMHKPVSYVSYKTAIVENSQITKGSHLPNLYDRIAFSKDKKYIEDQECRLLFTFIHPSYQSLSIKIKSILLPSASLTRWII
jgi:hypothetical protein